MPVWSADDKIVRRENGRIRKDTCVSDTLHTLTSTDRRSGCTN